MNLNEEARKKISESAKGRPPWNKGKTLPPEIKAKIAASTRKLKSIEELARAYEKMIKMADNLRKQMGEGFIFSQQLKAEGEVIKGESAKCNETCKVIAEEKNRELAKNQGLVSDAAGRQKRYRDRKKGLIPPAKSNLLKDFADKLNKEDDMASISDTERQLRLDVSALISELGGTFDVSIDEKIRRAKISAKKKLPMKKWCNL